MRNIKTLIIIIFITLILLLKYIYFVKKRVIFFLFYYFLLFFIIIIFKLFKLNIRNVHLSIIVFIYLKILDICRIILTPS